MKLDKHGVPAKLLRNILLAATYAAIIFVCLWFSLLLRFDFEVPGSYWKGFQTTLALLVPLKFLTLILFGQFRSLLTFFSLSDVKRLIFAMGLAGLVSLGLWYVSGGAWVVPRAVILTDFILSSAALVSLRTCMRIYREQMEESGAHPQANRKRVAIIGAGSSGAALFREILSKPGLGMDVVCFVDDDPAKIGVTLHGRQIAGRRADLPRLIEGLNLSRVIIAMPTASPAVIRETVGILNNAGIEHDILPSVTQILHKQVSVSHLRHVDPEDLLGREPVRLDEAGIQTMIAGKAILVTGAGGSIGSELCRQLAQNAPQKLILVERCEAALFVIEQELREKYRWLDLEPLAASVCDEDRMRAVFQTFRPEMVFHAAAHKHVPLMERQPAEAIRNNVLGSLYVARQAALAGCRKCIMVSTDKAVNPTNVMGATKRVAERIFSALQRGGGANGCIYAAVRFGNVLGSSGSVVPIFRKQISSGGPLTVTHPDVTRFFMSIPEAVGLILQSALQAGGGEIFVLDMGDPIRIQDLAKQMIEMSGLQPNKDIMIEFTGLRPGEKLYEEPIHRSETVDETPHPKVRVLRGSDTIEIAELAADIDAFRGELWSWSPARARAWLAGRVPEYILRETGS